MDDLLCRLAVAVEGRVGFWRREVLDGDGAGNRGGLDELRPRADDGDNFHVGGQVLEFSVLLEEMGFARFIITVTLP